MAEPEQQPLHHRLERRYAGADAGALLAGVIKSDFVGRIALTSSFGTEAALLLALVAEIDRDLPVLFVDTGQLFDETLRYRDRLVERLGLRDVRAFRPDPRALAREDHDGSLWYYDNERCCALRKVEPMRRASLGFDALISGRKRYHGALRRFLPRITEVDGVIRIDPLADWSESQVLAAVAARDLPPHPLRAEGYASVGCGPCSSPARAGEDVRAGRWRGQIKTECGIHLSQSPALAVESC